MIKLLNPFRKSVYGKRFAKRKVLGGEKEKKMKKMRKTKMLIAGLLVLSAMVVFASTAVAITSLERTPGEISIADGEMNAFTVTVLPSKSTSSGDVSAEILPHEGNFNIVIKDVDGTLLASGLGDSKLTASGISYTANVLSEFSVEVTNSGAQGEYYIGFFANDGVTTRGPDASIWATVKGEIPEFATIAIPVASILGLLFFFNHRKHKKE